MRAVALGKTLKSESGTIRSTLHRALPHLDLTSMRTLPGGAALTLLRLLRLQPRLVIAEAPGREALPAALYRVLAPSSHLLLCQAADRPERDGRVARFVAAQADEVLETDANVKRVVERLRLSAPLAPAQLLPLPADLDRFAAAPASRDAEASYRLLHVGPLSPESGAADLLVALAAWAEENPDRPVEICWAGRGDLAGVFEAQPLPANLTQRFLGELDRPALAELASTTGILVVPLAGPKPPVVEALAAGLVLVGERRLPALKTLVRAGAPAWTFDGRGQPDLAAAIGAALEASVAGLDAMREAGRALVRAARAIETPGVPDQFGGGLPPPSRLRADEAFP